jgi:hypothetical protein
VAKAAYHSVEMQSAKIFYSLSGIANTGQQHAVGSAYCFSIGS